MSSNYQEAINKWHGKPYYSLDAYLQDIYHEKIYKIALNAGLTCPNRDGTLDTRGCIFCSRGGSGDFAVPLSFPLHFQKSFEEGKARLKQKHTGSRFIAYFQAYTNTYAKVELLREMYEEALRVKDVVGIVIGTRPDCVSDELLDYLEELNRHTFVLVEYGIESANDETLKRINRGHDFACCRDAVERTHARGILTGGHIIIGLPGEDAEESLRQAPVISSLPLDILKIHQMQIIKGTRLAQEYAEHPFHVYTVEEYIDVIVRYIRLLRKDLVLERFVSQSPKDLLIAPKWGLKNYEFTNLLNNKLKSLQ